MDKRKRNVNFSAAEEELLVELVKKYQNIVENKKTDMVMWKEKEECWRKISEEFNSQGVGETGPKGTSLYSKIELQNFHDTVNNCHEIKIDGLMGFWETNYQSLMSV
ncbi:hypothetical protein QTP88_027470 [Uroleucon formosanum]